MLVSTFNIQSVKASGIVYVRADGSIDPSVAPISSADNVTYTFTGNINDSIVVERDDIVIDGNGYTLQGDGTGTGVMLAKRSNVTITRINVKGFRDGIMFYLSSSIVISENNITNNAGTGISFTFSSNNTISKNIIANNDFGIDLYGSSYSEISANNVSHNDFAGIVLEHSSNNSIVGNNVTNGGSIGVDVYQSSSNVISGNNVSANHDWGILISASDNTVSGNIITHNGNGIVLSGSNNTRVSANNVTNNDLAGIDLEYSSNNSISDNIITAAHDGAGISLHYSLNNSISGNSIANNEYGFYLDNSSDNSIFHNNASNNSYGILLMLCPENRIYRNNFVSNTAQVYKPDDYANTWDNGYEGNYWSDYIGIDSNFDGIGDSSYVIDSNNVDHYPLMNPYWNPSDVNHDLKVNLQDVLKTALAFGSYPGHPKWNPHCDIDEDGRVILVDYFAVCKNYGKKY